MQEDLHRQRANMDQARLGLIQRRGEAQDRLRQERERLSTRAWWRRPTSLATSSWVSSGGARTTTTPTPTAPASTVAWPPLETSMVAHRGDETVEMEVEEIRTVRLLDHTVDLANEEIEIEMDVDRARGEEDDARERTRASGRGKGKDGRNRD